MSHRALLTLVALCCASPVFAEDPPEIRRGDVELGVRISAVTVDGSTKSELGLRTGRFFGKIGGGHSFVEAELGYAHLLELDQLDLGVLVGWSIPLSDQQLHPYVAVGAAFREEWIGSFQRSRWPVGFDLGARLLVGTRAVVRPELRLRWVQDEANDTFLETVFALGISLRFPNS